MDRRNRECVSRFVFHAWLGALICPVGSSLFHSSVLFFFFDLSVSLFLCVTVQEFWSPVSGSMVHIPFFYSKCSRFDLGWV
jgi:hypothetical protein